MPLHCGQVVGMGKKYQGRGRCRFCGRIWGCVPGADGFRNLKPKEGAEPHLPGPVQCCVFVRLRKGKIMPFARPVRCVLKTRLQRAQFLAGRLDGSARNHAEAGPAGRRHHSARSSHGDAAILRSWSSLIRQKGRTKARIDYTSRLWAVTGCVLHFCRLNDLCTVCRNVGAVSGAVAVGINVDRWIVPVGTTELPSAI